jgi:hypothetical protein
MANTLASGSSSMDVVEPEKALPVQFVNLNPKDPWLGAKQKRSVRSHAMLKFMRDQRVKRHKSIVGTHESEIPTQANTAIVVGSTTAAELSNSQLLAGYSTNSPTSLLSPSRLDPFASCSIYLQPYMENAIQFGRPVESFKQYRYQQLIYRLQQINTFLGFFTLKRWIQQLMN